MRPAIAGDHQLTTIGREVQRLIVAAEPRQPFRFAASRRCYVDVAIAYAIAGEGTRFGIGRKARDEIARDMRRETMGIIGVAIGNPDVILSRKCSRAIVRDMRVARKRDRRILRCLRRGNRWGEQHRQRQRWHVNATQLPARE